MQFTARKLHPMVVGAVIVLMWFTVSVMRSAPPADVDPLSLTPVGSPLALKPLDAAGTPGKRLVDRRVQQAAAWTTAAPLVASLIGAEDPTPNITELVQDRYRWPLETTETTVRLRTTQQYTLTGTATGNAEVVLWIDDKATEVKEPPKNGVWTLQTPPAGAFGRISVKQGDLQSLPVVVVAPSTDVLAPRIENASNNAYVTPTPNAFNAILNVYDRYLQISGNNVPPNTQLRFRVFKGPDVTSGNVDPEAGPWTLLSTEAFAAPAVTPTALGSWNAVLEIPGVGDFRDGDTGVIEVLATRSTSHNYAVKAVKFRVSQPPQALSSPAFADSAVAATRQSYTVNAEADGKKYFSNTGQVTITGSLGASPPADGEVVLLAGDDGESLGVAEKNTTTNTWTAAITIPSEGTYEIRAAWAFGDQIVQQSEPIELSFRARLPKIESVQPINFVSTPNAHKVTVTFDEVISTFDTNNANDKFKLVPSTPGVAVELSPATGSPNPSLGADKKSVVLNYKPFSPDEFTFTVEEGAVTDRFGNTNEKYSVVLVKPIGAEQPLTSPGIPGPTGPYVPFAEYTDPRPIIDGFNPSDRVETRVSRLYYYRDAHRVAQIINRDAKSYNRAAVDMQQQLANKARQVADQTTDDRRAKERAAVRAAQESREAERQLQQAEATAQRAAEEAVGANAELQRKTAIAATSAELSDQDRTQLEADVKRLPSVVSSLEAVASSARQKVAAASKKVQEARNKEAEATEIWQNSIAVEDRAREDQFRREVAAANADPDTYAPGKPGSIDPVQQVSVSVIGEGLIQLRGPIKGINVIRTMINQIDTPVGQVRVGVHTVQINGEKGDRMEIVAGKIQRYIDHSRFLTLQSAEMLRKAIVQVAAMKAIELGDMPGFTQEDRDRKYLYSFFGEDFIRELEVLDSEFLMTGNKLLSIHSMDSTSLASAMFILALAKNSTRMQILERFEEMMATDLVMAEHNYFEAGVTCDGKQQLFTKHCPQEEFQLLSQNARFQSIRGMFDVEIMSDDTMTPMQREFLGLAQIFKSRLIVEMELKQRVMERAVIEERLGDRKKELEEAREKERVARQRLSDVRNETSSARRQAVTSLAIALGIMEENKSKVEKVVQDNRSVIDDFGAIAEEILDPANQENNRRNAAKTPLGHFLDNNIYQIFGSTLEQHFYNLKKLKGGKLGIVGFKNSTPPIPDEKETRFLVQKFQEGIEVTLEAIKPLRDFTFGDELQRISDESKKKLEELDFYSREVLGKLEPGDLMEDGVDYGQLRDAAIVAQNLRRLQAGAERTYIELRGQAENLLEGLSAESGSSAEAARELFSEWTKLRNAVEELVSHHPKERQILDEFTKVDNAFRGLIQASVESQFALQEAEAARRPLDHKKFLDMLVDEMEDKYIELLEGTRAHVANIDAYLKRLMTSLDDDFNTQFYYPTFRKVRLASQLWDVQMGQVETTNVLANNRGFGKVSPEATMEFDLPKRDILIAEAMDGAKAAIDDFGALTQDPTFLALSRLGSGQPTSTQGGGANGGLSTVRNVLPGLSTDTAEAVLGQQGPGGSQFGAALESLIPDPAIYKFETGTGWEIRPVIQPDGQAVVFDFNYMYTTNVREPVRADEKHLGRVKRHFVDTDVQLSNFELREISRYTVALKASRTSRGVPLLEDIPLVGVLFRPLPSDESSLQQNIILGQATIFPTLFDLMGLRWAPVVADLDPLRLQNDEFIVRNRRRTLMNRVFDKSSSEVDKFLRIPAGERRMDLYRSQETIPAQHPNGYYGPGANLRDSTLREGFDPTERIETPFVPGANKEGSELRPRRESGMFQEYGPALEIVPPSTPPEPLGRLDQVAPVRPVSFEATRSVSQPSPYQAPRASRRVRTSRLPLDR